MGKTLKNRFAQVFYGDDRRPMLIFYDKNFQISQPKSTIETFIFFALVSAYSIVCGVCIGLVCMKYRLRSEERTRYAR